MGLVTPFRDAVRGGAFVVSAVLVEGNAPVRGARVMATLTRAPDDPASRPIAVRELALADDGRGADTSRGDGVYSGIVAATTPGKHWIAVHATGTGVAGTPFERDAGTYFQASEPTVKIASVGPGEWLRARGSPRIARLTVPVQFKGPGGTYEVVVTLRASNGRRVGGTRLVDIARGRRARVIVSVDAETVRLLGANGPYGIESTEVFELTKQERVLRARKLGVDRTPPIELDALDVR